MAQRGMNRLSIVVPVHDEARALPATIANLQALDPPPDEVLMVDGGSSDDSVALAQAAGWRIVVSPVRGRGAQVNLGVAEAAGDLVCVLHADSLLPGDAVSVIRGALADSRLALGSFTPRIAGPDGTRWVTTAHNMLKTWYAPLITRPHLFVRGVRLLFGDHAMFFRRAQFLAVGGCDASLPIMEEADLCIKMARLGKIRMVRRWVWTSDRRIAAWGPVRANWIYFKVGILWAIGARKRLGEHYPDVR
jgi:glycosyltransferase involved in cell wall biosynthesis